jgi:hypothetical protein
VRNRVADGAGRLGWGTGSVDCLIPTRSESNCRLDVVFRINLWKTEHRGGVCGDLKRAVVSTVFFFVRSGKVL